MEMRGYSVKEWNNFAGHYRHLPDNLLLKWLLRILGVSALNTSDYRGIFGLTSCWLIPLWGWFTGKPLDF